MQAARATATVSYDPNVRPALMGSPANARAALPRWLATADVVKVSEEDLRWVHPGTDLERQARSWLDEGPTAVVVTMGRRGAFVVAACGTVEVPADEVDVVDTVGAGDAFTSGLLDGLAAHDVLGAERRERLRALSTQSWQDVLRWATTVAGLTVGRPGADPPHRAQLLETVQTG